MSVPAPVSVRSALPRLPPLVWLLLAGLCAAIGPAARAGPIGDEPGSKPPCLPAVESLGAAGDLSALLARRVPATRDVSCYLGRRELEHWRESDQLVIVDARTASEFRKLRIPGSVNFGMRYLKARDHLRRRPLLLVDRGYSGDALERACRDLRDAGFSSVGILTGGLHFWASHLGDLEGDRLEARRLGRVPVEAFVEESRFDHWMILDVSPAPASDLTRLLPGVQSVPAGPDRAAFRRALVDRIRDRRAQREDIFVAIIDEDGRRYEQVERALDAAQIPHVFFVAGGLEAYRRYVDRASVSAAGRGAGCPR